MNKGYEIYLDKNEFIDCLENYDEHLIHILFDGEAFQIGMADTKEDDVDVIASFSASETELDNALAEQILDKYYNDKAKKIMKDMIKEYDDVEGMYDENGDLVGIKKRGKISGRMDKRIRRKR